ncbi:trypsin-like peptidase domain-containing protein [Leptothermofonsia sp. ETS-13]|uniref:trypsin-like peptidase domain-containing protein n=1 Tax=Leptothermofonsia sp. ETS-13 TaxID=3035696 RepID=UPI003BA19322
MLRQFAISLIAPTLIPAQLPTFQNAQTNLDPQVSAAARPAVVRVVAGCSGKYSYGSIEYSFAVGEVGSGFFINPNGYIATNAHLLRPTAREGCEDYVIDNLAERINGRSSSESISGQTKAELRNSIRIANNIDYFTRVILPNGDSFPFETKKMGKSLGGDSEDIAIIKIQLTNAPTIQFADSSDPKPQDPVTVVTYPLRGETSSFFSPLLSGDLPSNQPLGRVEVLNGQILDSSKLGGSRRSFLQLNSRFSIGISGSPLLNSKGEAIGMITLGSEDAGGNITSAVLNQTLLPFIKEFNGTRKDNPTNHLYREGLGLLQKGDFKGAKANFEKLRDLFPYHSEVYFLIDESDRGLAEAKEKTRLTFLLAGAGVLGGVILAGYWLLKRKHSRLRRVTPSFAASLPNPSLKPDEATAKELGVDWPKPSVEADRDSASPEYVSGQAAVTQISGNVSSPATVIGLQPFVELKNQDGKVKRFYLHRDRHYLGRDRGWADLYILEGGWEVISRRHAVFEREGDDYRIYDGDRQNPSTNGILINNTPVTTQEGYLLKDGDQLQTGQDARNQVILTYSNPGRSQSSSFQMNGTSDGHRA